MREMPSLQERIRIYTEGDAEWEWYLTTHQIADLPGSAHVWWKPLDWVNYIGENWRKRAAPKRERSSVKPAQPAQPAQPAPIETPVPIQQPDISKMSAKARAALAAQTKGN